MTVCRFSLWSESSFDYRIQRGGIALEECFSSASVAASYVHQSKANLHEAKVRGSLH